MALHLLRSLAAGPRVDLTLLDPSPSLGDGVAYGTRDDAHLINVLVGRMGAVPEEPGDFLAWLQASGHSARAGSFVPRALFGAYLREWLAGVEAAAPAGVQLQHARRRAVDLQRMPGGWRAVDDAGGCWDAEAVVLATGQGPAPPPPGWQVERLGAAWLESPRGTPGLGAVPEREDVLLLGTGLTAVDAVLTLARRRHRGRVLAVSRHGRWPLVHDPLAPEAPAASPGMSLRAALRVVRAQALRGDGRASV
ncbi:MAG: FAD/NAD(P)-binding protein, partial [Deltaproteobacteria bacterium]|nr:FAD/NAD(P)-binding protein [Deltaproteobacteria bacterium]